MTRILAFTRSPADWKSLLADPEKHWRSGYSARALAYSWEAVEGFPPEVAEAFEKCVDPLLQHVNPVLAVPEFKVPLPGGNRASQNDIFVLAKSSAGPVSIMVEGKVDESFGPTLEDWSTDWSDGKRERLRYLVKNLGLDADPPQAIRYQLLHRSASAMITAEQYRAVAAVILVHTFTRKDTGWSDYEAFLRLFGIIAERKIIQRLPTHSEIPLFSAWIPGDLDFLTK